MAEKNSSSLENAIVISFIRQMRVAMKNFQLYPPGSSLVQESVKIVYNNIMELLAHRSEVTISESDKRTLFEGQLVKFKGSEQASGLAFAETFSKFNIKSVTFHQGVTLDEMSALLEGLGKKTGPAQVLEERNVKGIRLNERIYVMADESKKPEDTGKPSSVPEPPGVEEKPRGAEPSAGGTGKLEGIIYGEEVSSELKVPEQATGEERLIIQTENLLKADPMTLVEKQTKEKLPELLRELDRADKTEMAGEVVEKLADNLENKETQVRLDTVRTFKEAAETIESLSDKKIVGKLDDKFIEQEEKETDEQVYTELAELLELGVGRMLRESDYEKTDKIVTMFRRHSASKDEGFFKRWRCALTAMQKIANSDVIDIIISDLRSSTPEVRAQAYNVVMKLEETAVEPLVEMIKATEDIHLRKVIAFALKKMGDNAIAQMIRSLESNMPAENSKRILGILDGIGSEGVIIEQLEKMLSHHDAEVRKEVLKVLSRFNTSAANKVIRLALDDFRIDVRMETIRILGKIKDKEAAEPLLQIVSFKGMFAKEKETEEIQAEACLALGVIGNIKALPTLIEIAKPAGPIKFLRLKPMSVRLAAIQAIAEFQSPETREVFAMLLNDKDPAIVKASRNAMDRQKRILDEKAKKVSGSVL